MTEDNPYVTPQADLSCPQPLPNLDKLIWWQRVMLLSFCFASLILIAGLIWTNSLPLGFRLLFFIVLGALFVAAANVAYRLGTHPLMVALFGLCLCLPVINLLLILRLNARACDAISRSGLEVGILGAKGRLKSYPVKP